MAWKSEWEADSVMTREKYVDLSIAARFSL